MNDASLAAVTSPAPSCAPLPCRISGGGIIGICAGDAPVHDDTNSAGYIPGAFEVSCPTPPPRACAARAARPAARRTVARARSARLRAVEEPARDVDVPRVERRHRRRSILHRPADEQVILAELAEERRAEATSRLRAIGRRRDHRVASYREGAVGPRAPPVARMAPAPVADQPGVSRRRRVGVVAAATRDDEKSRRCRHAEHPSKSERTPHLLKVPRLRPPREAAEPCVGFER